MQAEVKLPRLSEAMASGTIIRWLKAEGEVVEEQEPLYEVETDKVTQEVEVGVSGVLLRIVVREGDVAVGSTVAIIGEVGTETPTEQDPEIVREQPVRAPPRKQVKFPAEPDSSLASSRLSGVGVKASPLARRIARERRVDLAGLTGTGPEGRIVAEDVEQAAVSLPPVAPAAPSAPPSEVERVGLTSLRRTVARRMTEAWAAPAFQISMSAEMRRVSDVRARLVEAYPRERPTVTDVLVKACAVALVRHRAVNALYAGDAVELQPAANIGIATATERGLLVPVVHGCERLSLAEIAAARADLVERARAGRLQAGDLEGGTFTVSNLGMFGVEQFIAVLNPPQAAILAVGAIEDRVVPVGGEVAVRPLMTMTLTCDHRTVDGATAAEFLRTVKELLEEPGLAL